MKKVKIPLVVLVSIAIFLLVYYPHYHYPFPRHVDEWHHITEAIRLEKGEYPFSTIGYRVGFHIILLLLSKITNLIPIYRFLPAVWAVISGLVLFYVVYRKTDNRFDIALFAMIFFASIKSNVNILGLWFFTPLSFSIPFIYLYVYFFTGGIEKQDKKFLIISLLIMALLLPIHSISVLFAIPFLLIYCLCNLKYLKKEWPLFFMFLIIVAIGALFYKFMTEVPWQLLTQHLANSLKFKYGWGVLELKNSPFELYSLIGYILAFAGLILIFRSKKSLKKYLAYGLWPITVFISIVIFRITGVSYLSPYQRNLYYFAISLPILSAFGLDYLLKGIKQTFKKIGLVLVIIIFPGILIFTFKDYLYIPKQIELYEIIDKKEYNALLFLANIPEKATVMAIPRISVALYPVSEHKPIATYAFYAKEKREEVERFFSPQTSNRVRQEILNKYHTKYILSRFKMEGGWKPIYEDGCYIYEVD